MVPERMRLSLRSYPGQADTHVHDFHQAALPIDGALDIQVGGAGGSVSGRQGVMIARGARHVFRACGPNRFIVLDMNMAPEVLTPVVPRSPFFGFDETLAELARYAGNELRSGELDTAAQFHLAALIAGKIRRCCIAPPRWSAPVERVLAVLRERHAERLTMVEVASAADLGVSRLHELFRRETGRTPAEMLAEIRLDHAEDLLGRTRLPIAEIALLVGYSEQSALTRSLRRRRGTTPRALRRAVA